MTATQRQSETEFIAPAQDFIDAVRGLFAKGLEETALWCQIGEKLHTLLASPELQAHTRTWPDTKVGNGPPSNLLFYEDPD